jgi:hypothetical protein
MGYESDDDEQVEEDHLNGLHYGEPHPTCYMCEEDDEPEACDP